jgi:DNA-binding CsgD family transcriptional regulator
VAVRLARLPEEATRLASAVAVLGDGADLRVAAELAGLELEQAAHAATTLGRADLLRLETPLEFVHPVVRGAVYEQTPLPDRLAAHRRAAALLSAAGHEPEQAAAHLLVTPPAADEGVVAILRDAAARARRRGASEAAVTYLRRALEEPPSDVTRGTVLADLGLAERRVDLAPAAVTLGEAVAAAADPVRGARLALELARTLRRLDRERQALAVLDTAAIALGDAQPDLREVLEAEAIGVASFDPALHAAARKRLEEKGEDEWHGELGNAMQRAIRRNHDARLGVNRERMQELATPEVARLLLDGDAAAAGSYVETCAVIAGYFEPALEFNRVLLEEARNRGDLVLVTGTLNFRAFALWHTGELVAAEDDLRESLDLSAVPEVRQAHSGIYQRSFLANVLVDRGDLEGAQAELDAVGLTDESAANVHSFYALFARARLALARQEAERARRDQELLGRYMKLHDVRNPGYLSWRSELALALAALDRRDEAVALASEELELARHWGAPHVVGAARRALGVVQGGARGIETLREAVAELEDSGARLALAKALVDLGSALRRGKKQGEARELLRRGLEHAHRLGAHPLEELASSELAATGARPRRISLSGAESLTPSERRVAELAADGLSNRDVAQTLYVTTKTVEVHLSSAYRKLGISSRGELAAALAG